MSSTPRSTAVGAMAAVTPMMSNTGGSSGLGEKRSRDGSISQRVAIEGRCGARLCFRTMTRIRIDPSGARRRLGGCPRPVARARPALDAAATHADRGPVAVRRPRDRLRTGRALPRDRPRRPSPRPSTGRSTSSRSSACSATATAPTAARSSTSCRRPSTATCTASIAGRPGRSRPDEAAALVASLERRRGFAVDVTHLSIAGRCADCSPPSTTERAPACGDLALSRPAERP